MWCIKHFLCLANVVPPLHKRHRNLGASWAERNFWGSKVCPLEVELFFCVLAL